MVSNDRSSNSGADQMPQEQPSLAGYDQLTVELHRLTVRSVSLSEKSRVLCNYAEFLNSISLSLRQHSYALSMQRFIAEDRREQTSQR
jgi:hypothetical protein